jgi:sigma-B regulation protein RsbU (phosphoserine phosphatase)
MFVTVFACLLDLTTRVLSFANAGHNKPLIARSGGAYEFLELKRGLPLGVSPDFPYVSSELTLNEGDRLYLYTDGINEAENPPGDQFGNERLLETANSCRELAPRDFDEALRRRLAEFVNGAEQSDDITSLAFVFSPKKV